MALLCALLLPGVVSAQWQSSGKIAGVVRDGESRPVPGAMVEILGTAYTVTVGDDGAFQFVEVPPGKYSLMVSGVGIQRTQMEHVTVEAGKVTNVTLGIRRSSLPFDDPISTPGKRTQPLRETSASSTILTAHEIHARNGSRLDRVLDLAPGVAVSGGQPSIRGSGSSLGGGSRVALLVDGMPYLDPGSGAVPSTMLPLQAVEQVEIVKGASSALHGTSALGGVVQLITREPSDLPQASVRGYSGFYTPADQSAPWGGVQRFAGLQGTFSRRSGLIGLLISGNVHHDDGYRQYDDRDRYNVFGKMIMTIDPHTELRMSASIGGDKHGNFRAWRAFDSALYAPGWRDDSIRSNDGVASFVGELRGSSSRSFFYRARAGYLSLSHDDSRSMSDTLKQTYSSARYMGELQLNSFFNPYLLFTYGGVMQFDVNGMGAADHPVMRTTALFAQLELSNREDITATVGGRLDNIMMAGRSSIELSPRVGVSYRPYETTSLRMSLARGFRAPSFVERYGIPTSVIRRSAESIGLGSERVWEGEIGATHEMHPPKLVVTSDVAVFVHEYFGLIEPVVEPGDTIVYRNDTRARILGLDLQMRFALDGAPLTFGIDVSAIAPKDLARAGRELPGRAATVAHFFLRWAPDPFTLLLDYRYASRVEHVDEASMLLIPDAEEQVETQTVDFHASVDLREAMQIPVTAFLATRNLLQYNATNGIGSLAPVRSIEVGVEGRF